METSKNGTNRNWQYNTTEGSPIQSGQAHTIVEPGQPHTTVADGQSNTTVAILGSLLGVIVVCLVVVVIFFIRRDYKRKKRKRKQNAKPRASPLLPRKSRQPDRPSSNTSDSAYAETIICEAPKDTGGHGIRKVNENKQTAVPLPPRQHRSNPDVTVHVVRQSTQPPLPVGAAPRRPQSNPLIAALAVNQSLASWPSRQSSSASDTHVRLSRNRQFGQVDFQTSMVDQYTQTSVPNSTVSERERWSTNIDVITPTFHERKASGDLENEETPLLSSDLFSSDQRQTRSRSSESGDETELLKPFSEDEDSIQHIPNASRRRRSTLNELHHMVSIHSECESQDDQNDGGEECHPGRENGESQTTGATSEAVQLPVDESNMQCLSLDENDHMESERAMEPLSTLRALQALIHEKDQRLQRKEKEKAHLEQKNRELLKEIERKDVELKEISCCLSEMIRTFPRDRLSLDFTSNKESPMEDNQTNNAQEIYYSTRPKRDSE